MTAAESLPVWKRVWTDPVWSKVIGACIFGTLSLLAASMVGPTRRDVSTVETGSQTKHASVEKPLTLVHGVSQTIDEGAAFIDPETDFSFTVMNISDGIAMGFIPLPPVRYQGVFGYWLSPSGEKGPRLRHLPGLRVRFVFGGADYVFVIVGVDHKARRATFRVDKLRTAQ